jgi:hypothetical protein
VCRAILESGFEITEVVSGHARGVDLIGETYAEVEGIPVKTFVPEWEVYGFGAGHFRNAAMADYADAAVVVWDGESRGSKNMIEEMQKREKPVFVRRVEKN